MSVSELTSIIDRLLPEPHASLLAGILFGTKENLPHDLYQNLIVTGTLHIVALSGMNISILTSLVSTTFLRFVSRRLSSLLTIVVIIGFILFVGPSPSVVRAGIMGTLPLVAIMTGKASWSLFSLFLTGGIMLVIHPPWALDISFQLSFFATLGILLFGQKTQISPKQKQDQTLSAVLPRSTGIVPAFFNSFGALVRDDLRITLSAQVFTIPIILLYFYRISIISPLTNVLIGWTIPFITLLGFVSVLLGLVWEPLASPVAWLCWLILEYLIKIVTLTGAIPYSSLDFGLY